MSNANPDQYALDTLLALAETNNWTSIQKLYQKGGLIVWLKPEWYHRSERLGVVLVRISKNGLKRLKELIPVTIIGADA